MGTKFLLAIGLLACAGLSGCNNGRDTPAATTQTSVQPCDCQTAATARAEAAPAATARRHIRHHSSYSRREYDETGRYAYRSQSRTYYQSGYNGDTERHSDYREEADSGGRVWVDGYGKRYYYAAAVAAARPLDDHARRDAWHGYDEVCDDGKNK
ncbi:MAG: hypothetical protein KGJ79_03925 [Alphaproteobacteria bacterium]|nr:hypothetical protein [Alphaproteobacteria bacterium]MDE2495196.1 hypothetical protein [Alphaproteobacteria bacterium]